MRSARVDYDTIAELYDETPHRTKEVDPEFLNLIGERGSSGGLAVLDIGCGTGNQLIANSAAYMAFGWSASTGSQGCSLRPAEKPPI
jgi:ubiquinone/menaquinone biosynthesis C-methylase UbiE